MSQIQAALFTLSGGGDTSVFLAPKSALDWCFEARPGDKAAPDNVLADLAPFLRPDADIQELTERLYITPGSPDNDAALFLPCVCTPYDTAIQAVRSAVANGWTLSDEDEYSVHIY